MQTKLISLKGWIAYHYGDYESKLQKDCAAESLCVGISTIYRWLKDDNVFIEEIDESIAGDDSGLRVWNMNK
jgi:hypothetical protein